MRRAVFTLVVSACACAGAREIETTDWGMCWRRPDGMAKTVASTNTPGSDAFSNCRLTAPVYYAWLDGFDARHRVAQCDDREVSKFKQVGERLFLYTDIETNALRRVRNTTYRLAFFDSMKERCERIRKLDTWPNPADHGQGYANNGEYWGSSFMDAVAPGPKRHDFEWTEEIVPEIFDDELRTAWFSNFRTLQNDAVFTPRHDGYLAGDFANEFISALTFRDWPLMDSYYTRHGSDCTPYGFMTILTNAYENLEVTNLVKNSRRLVVNEMAARNQTLALFDKRVRSGYMWDVCTNEVVKHYNYRLEADVVYDGEIEITEDGFGNYHATPLDKSVNCGTVSVTNSVCVSNFEVSVHSPWLMATSPTYSFGSAIYLKKADDGGTLDETGGELKAYLDATFAALGSDEVMFMCQAAISDHGWDSAFYIAQEDLMTDAVYEFKASYFAPGRYTPMGSASLTASYDVYDVSHVYTMPLPITFNWPAEKSYLSTNHVFTTVGTSFAATQHATPTTDSHCIGDFSIDFWDDDGHASKDWDERIGFGYKSKTYETTFRSEVDAGIYRELRILEQKIGGNNPGTDYPDYYTEMSIGDLARVCSVATNWVLVSQTKFYDESEQNPGWIELNIRRQADGKFRYRPGRAKDYSKKLRIFSSAAWLMNVSPDPLAYDYGWRTNAFYIKTKNHIVQECKFDFTQVRLKEEDNEKQSNNRVVE